jgi:recombination protein RecR
MILIDMLEEGNAQNIVSIVMASMFWLGFLGVVVCAIIRPLVYKKPKEQATQIKSFKLQKLPGIINFKKDIKYCKVCHNISDTDVCSICANPKRDTATICVVENIQDVLAIENTMQFNGLYHVLGGVISPMDGIGPSNLKIAELVKRVEDGGVKEIIFALSPTMEGDTTNFFISRKLSSLNVKLSVIARGVTIGNNLEYADEVSLGRSIVDRTPFI